MACSPAVTSERKIIHIDMDCFYAAIEMRERPELATQPLAVGGSVERRGVITTCNYEARRYGVRSAMPTFKALELCPQLVLLPVRFDVYRQESRQIRAIFQRWTSVIEPLSLDEAYLDVSHRSESAVAIASAIRRSIYAETRLTASAGIAGNKLLAKIASDWRKPNGQFVIAPGEIAAFMEALPVRKLWGIGGVTAQKLEHLGIQTCGDLTARLSRFEMARRFGKWGVELHDLAQGIDHRPVEPNRERKSLSTERTFPQNLGTLPACEAKLAELYDELIAELTAHPAAAGRVVRKAFLKLRFADFTRTTVECIEPQPQLATYQRLLGEAFARRDQSIRLIGIGVRFAELRDDPQLFLSLAEGEEGVVR